MNSNSRRRTAIVSFTEKVEKTSKEMNRERKIIKEG